VVIGLYGSGMHDFVLREYEIGRRAAAAEDAEQCGYGALADLDFLAWELCDHDCEPCNTCTGQALRIMSGAEPPPWPREDPTAGIVELHGDRKYLV
jgi:hypothetical protein